MLGFLGKHQAQALANIQWWPRDHNDHSPGQVSDDDASHDYHDKTNHHDHVVHNIDNNIDDEDVDYHDNHDALISVWPSMGLSQDQVPYMARLRELPC